MPRLHDIKQWVMKHTIIPPESRRAYRPITSRTVKRAFVGYGLYLLYIAASFVYLSYVMDYPTRFVGEWAVEMSLVGAMMITAGLLAIQLQYWNGKRKAERKVS